MPKLTKAEVVAKLKAISGLLEEVYEGADPEDNEVNEVLYALGGTDTAIKEAIADLEATDK